MKKSRIVLNWSRTGDSKLDTMAARILECMTGNADFPAPTPSLADLALAHGQYSSALTAAQSRDRAKVALKNEARQTLKGALTQLGHYVTLVSNGNRAMQMGSGYPLNAELVSPKKISKAVQNFSVVLGKNSGEVIVSVDALPGAKYYIFYYAPYGEDKLEWRHESDTVCSCTITGLEPLKKYSFRIEIRGTKKQFAETEIITKAVV